MNKLFSTLIFWLRVGPDRNDVHNIASDQWKRYEPNRVSYDLKPGFSVSAPDVNK